MNNIKNIIIVATVLFLSACTSLPQPIWYQSTAELIEAQQYKKALQQIQHQLPVDTKQLENVRRLARQQQLTKSKSFKKLIAAKEWARAKKILREVQLNLPPHRDFSRWQKQFNKALHNEQRLINTEQALLQAQLLKIQFKQQDLTRRSHETFFNWFNNKSELITHKQQLAEQLIQLSTQAIAKRDYNNAQKTYAQALEFDQQLGRESLHQAINDWLSEQNYHAIQKRQASLIRQLRNAMNKMDFKQLIKIEGILSKAPFSGKTVHAMLKKAQNLRQNNAISLNEQANTHYRDGSISQAIEFWLQAQKLAPGRHDITRKLLRAKKVQQKLRRLTNKQANG